MKYEMTNIERELTAIVEGVHHTSRLTALNKLYIEMASKGHEVAFLNEKYISIDGCSYQLRKKGLGLEVRMF